MTFSACDSPPWRASISPHWRTTCLPATPPTLIVVVATAVPFVIFTCALATLAMMPPGPLPLPLLPPPLSLEPPPQATRANTRTVPSARFRSGFTDIVLPGGGKPLQACVSTLQHAHRPGARRQGR